MFRDRILYQVDKFALMVCEYSTYDGKYTCAYLGTAQYLFDHYNLGKHTTNI